MKARISMVGATLVAALVWPGTALALNGTSADTTVVNGQEVPLEAPSKGRQGRR
ncbi:hypothetical protein [Bifidobacterium xylocopae]|uniref:hypothetical protein n=1 Tax=Bifidobacterium xylocopae TaxID=2493119 RepID=UPI00191BBDC2|nr:hypothetical protein [Bifidobacterium xylocopae]